MDAVWLPHRVRPNGPTEPSPGLRPQADALGSRPSQLPRALKGRQNSTRCLNPSPKFQDEFRAFLRRYEIEFDERYVWD